MKKNTPIHSQVEAREILLSSIQMNAKNPRKTFDETSLHELAQSIQEVGLIQPVIVRPIEKDKYELIAGERRYRACQILNWKTISCLVKEVDDEGAMEIAFVENLQREDVPVMEEAQAYRWLLENKNYDYQSLAAKVGKSERTIRMRIKLLNLIPEIQERIDVDIPLGHAEEICKYSTDIQQEIVKKYNPNFPGYMNYGYFTLSQLKERLAYEYTCVLDNFHFDKAACQECQYNTASSLLFDDMTSRCQNINCLKKKANEHILTGVLQLMNEHPELVLYEQCSRIQDADTIQLLKENGLELQEPPRGYRVMWNIPQRSSYEDQSEYETAMKDYMQRQGLTGKVLIPYIELTMDEVNIGYLCTDNIQENGVKGKLIRKAEREKDLAIEKILVDVKQQVITSEPVATPMLPLETELIYFIMMASLKQKDLQLIGGYSEKKIWDETLRAELMSGLTEEQKAVIARAFIFDNLRNCFTSGTQADLLISWVRLHYPDQVSAIETLYKSVMKKRLSKIALRLSDMGENEEAQKIQLEIGDIDN